MDGEHIDSVEQVFAKSLFFHPVSPSPKQIHLGGHADFMRAIARFDFRCDVPPSDLGYRDLRIKINVLDRIASGTILYK
jgi:hypothetical protein